MRVPVKVLRLRRAVQVLTLVVLCALPWLNAKGWNGVMGNFYALRLGDIPFADPLSVVQTLAGGSPGWRLWGGALLALGIALALGRVFCGWVCPYGLLSEVAAGIRGRRRAGQNAQPYVWLARGVLACAGVALTCVLGVPALNAVSGPGLLSLAPQLWPEGAVVLGGVLLPVFAALAVEAITGRRWWCRYACPQALLLMVAAWCGGRGLRVSWTPAACSCAQGQRPCETACSLELRPRHAGGPSRALCVQCGACVTACAQRGGALQLGVGAEAQRDKAQRGKAS